MKKLLYCLSLIFVLQGIPTTCSQAEFEESIKSSGESLEFTGKRLKLESQINKLLQQYKDSPSSKLENDIRRLKLRRQRLVNDEIDRLADEYDTTYKEYKNTNILRRSKRGRLEQQLRDLDARHAEVEKHLKYFKVAPKKRRSR